METIGKIIKVSNPETGISNSKEWKRQGFVITFIKDIYEREVYITGWGKRFNFDLLQVGYTVSLKFSIKSNEYQNKWYTNINAHEIHLISNSNYGIDKDKDLGF